jgi:hypothetical protein
MVNSTVQEPVHHLDLRHSHGPLLRFESPSRNPKIRTRLSLCSTRGQRPRLKRPRHQRLCLCTIPILTQGTRLTALARGDTESHGRYKYTVEISTQDNSRTRQQRAQLCWRETIKIESLPVRLLDLGRIGSTISIQTPILDIWQTGGIYGLPRSLTPRDYPVRCVLKDTADTKGDRRKRYHI